ncbi:MAG: hypothetical protein CL503_04100 [Actinobacteria bacterium]|nr:hypothetical protein [Actinomycetota bacterium]|tara:strand:+ start:1466 stop:2293 length:828 start_codon:yes stop_codon:yes gene_type:complete
MLFNKKDSKEKEPDSLFPEEEKPSFFSMSSPTLDALVLKVKGLLQSSADKDAENVVETKVDKKAEKDVDKEAATEINDDSEQESDDAKIEKESNKEEIVSSYSQGDDGSNNESEGEADSLATEVVDKEDVEELALEESSSAKDDDAEFEDDQDVTHQEESLADEDSDDNVELTDLDPVSDLANDSVKEMESEVSEATEETATATDQEDETVLEKNQEEFNDDVSLSGTDMTVDSDDDTEVPVAPTIFKPNSVLGDLDAQVLKSFSRKKNQDLTKR